MQLRFVPIGSDTRALMNMIRQRGLRGHWLAVALLAALLPFELKTPLVSLGPLVITNVEVLLYLLIAWWIGRILRAQRLHWTVAHSAVLTWLIIQFIAAFFAPVERDAAIKFALRSAGGAAIFFIAAEWIRTPRGTAWGMAAIALGAVISALAGLLELQSTSIQSALLIFKTQATQVGGQVRASGTFQYANTAAMYWEAALPIILTVGVWWSSEQGKQRWLIFALVTSCIVMDAIILSASRGALVSTIITLGVLIIVDRIGSTRSGLGRPASIALMVLGVLVGIQLIINPVFTARLRSESDDTWFRATMRPAQTELIAAANDIFTTTVVVTNTSVRTWPAGSARPVNISYHWIQPDSRRVLILDGERTALPHDVAPGEAAVVAALVKVPPLTGTLLLQWDLVQEDVTWFSERGGAVSNVKVHVTPAQQHRAGAVAAVRGQLSNATSPPRSQLWQAGTQMWLRYPLLGVGPDNFRHIYGQYLGQAEFDDLITTNSWYVELLATTGVVGFIAWLLIPTTLVLIARRQWGLLGQRERMLVSGLGMALVAFFLHGAVDYFMEFTPTYGLFWLITGLFVGLLTGIQDVKVVGISDRI